ncbi:spore germination protein [Pullulanibacillus pueri]|uniref:Germination protein XA n=1 Tax=Pullulanibacillus pueri TaxID=1437324 RepID=A0A8J3EJN9_9BACL|nr:Ger(x)C family spore germination protein [Pullulanibacillus pueri]MBM7680010.1 spore germination protein [Pullulanibacillus pueri]GGH73923.1 germination protein XA [Pullulanibacillus pueri]
MLKRSKPILYILCITLLMFSLSGCVRTRVIDDIHLAQIVGYDTVPNDDDSVLGTISVPIYTQSGGSGVLQPQSDNMSVIAHRGSQIRSNLESVSEYPLEVGKLMTILFSKDIAEKGLYTYIDFYKRNPDVGRGIVLAVSDGSAGDIINGQYKTNRLVSEYIMNLVNNNSRNNSPKTNLHYFLYSYYNAGMDPFLPIIKKEEDDLKIEGIALFKKDRYVDMIPYSQAFLFKMLYQSFAGGNFSVPIKDKYVSISSISSRVSYRFKKLKGGNQEITIKIKQKGFLRETERKLEGTTTIPYIQKAMEKYLTKNANTMVKHLQELNVDSLGLGDHIRSNDRGWNAEKWNEVYPHLNIKVNIDVELKQTGITD